MSKLQEIKSRLDLETMLDFEFSYFEKKDLLALKEIISQLEQTQEELVRIDECYQEVCEGVALIQAENEQLKADKQKLVEVLDETETFIQAISSYRGQNLEVANWHLNGDLEPFDNLLEDNGVDDIMVKIDKTLRARQVLSEVNKT